VLAGKAGHCAGQSWRALEELTVQPVGTLGEVDVLTEVGGEFDERNAFVSRV